MTRAAGRSPSDVVITGVGAISPAGFGHEALWDAVLRARVSTGPVSRFDTSRHPSHCAGEVPASALSALDASVPPHPCLAARYLAATASEAVHGAGLAHDRTAQGRTGVFAGTVMASRMSEVVR